MNKVKLPRSVEVVPLSADDAVSVLRSHVNKQKPGYSLALNAEKIIKLHEDEGFKEVFKKAAILVCDGVGLNLFSGVKLAKINLPVEVVEACQEFNMSLAIIGGGPSVASMAAENIRKKYNINIVFAVDGFSTDNDYLTLIKMHKPDVVFLGLGSPKQEYLALNLIKETNSFYINVGGALNIFAGNSNRAPEFIVNSNFEWLYRLILQPQRARRYVKLVKIFYIKLCMKWQ